MKTMILMVALTVLVVFAGSALGGQNGAVLAFAMATIMNFGMYWFSDKIVLKMYGAKQVTEQESPELFRIVRDLTMKANLPMPKVYIMDNPAPNAFATGRNPNHAAVAVTSGILNILSKDELSGVLGHELAHIKHRDILIGTIAATMAGAISMLANMAQWAMIFGGRSDRDDEGGSPIAGIVMIIVAPIAAMLIQMAISRSREYIADEGGARIHGNPLSLANALKKLHNASQRIPMDATPATSHMFIVSPLRGGGVLS
jgi:heat shock protein HtpX